MADNEQGDDGSELKVKSKPTLNEFHYTKGDKEVRYAMWLWTGSDQQPHQRLTLNVAPQWGQRKTASIYYRGAADYAAEIAGQKIVFHDENSTGVLGDDPDGLMIKDLRLGGAYDNEKAAGHPMLDSVTLGSSRGRAPFSNFVKVGPQWYRLRINNQNEELAYRPLDPASFDTGTLVVKHSGPPATKPKTLVLREVGFFKGAYFEVMATPKGVEVPCGLYEIFYGRVINGKGDLAKTCVVHKGVSDPIKVEMKKTTTVTIGAPFKIEFEVQKEGDKYTVSSTSTWVKGAVGEKYIHFNDEILEPEVAVSKDATGRGAKPVGQFKRIGSTDQLEKIGKTHQDMRGVVAPYFAIDAESGNDPRFEVSFTAPFTGTLYTGLRQKGHKMFGDLQAVWK
jgi:hypothetical protein